MDELVTLQDIRSAGERIKGVTRRTPLERCQWLSAESVREVMLKPECFQVTGSFKIRGAMAKLAALTPDERARGVLTVSAGNHGLAVAHAAQALSLEATIVVPRTASPAKVAAIKGYDVKLIEQGDNYDQAERAARALERETGLTFVSPYNDPMVIAGQGTVAIELLEDDAPVDTILVPVGGGGLLAGVLVAAKALNPRVKVYGVEPRASPTMTAALEAGHLVEIEEDATIADGLAGNIEPGSITFPIIQRLVDDVILVGEDAIRSAIARMAREEHLMIEGSGAAGIAALADRRVEGSRVAVIVTGRNISFDLFAEVVSSLNPA